MRGFYLEIKQEDRAPGSGQEGTKEPPKKLFFMGIETLRKNPRPESCTGEFYETFKEELM